MPCTRVRPGNRPRTSARAVITPNTTFTGTTIATMSSDSWKAEMAAGVVMESTKAPMPFSNVRHRMTISGSTSSTNR
ncbi:Uncharacterised protein [Mycobacteroides abscessus subsp. abscessus]|nr:Uncharacterised protein [Mycobacteroides abscessus subsp. abscessus]